MDISTSFSKFEYQNSNMRIIVLAVFLGLFLVSCKKDKFTSEPQIEFKSVDPNFTSIDVGAAVPQVTFSVTDSEGDLGFRSGSDTAFIYISNRKSKSDSLPFPDLGASGKSNFKADVTVSLANFLECTPLTPPELHIDTLYFDIYVRDFKKNKSNVIATSAVYFNCR
jgi:hypothetical protein